MALGGTELIIIAAVLAAASTTVAVVQGQQAASQRSKALRYQAQVAQNNQILAQRAADDATRRGDIAAAEQRQAARALVGRQRAVGASSGVVVDEDDFLKLTADTAALGEFEALKIEDNAAREALNFNQQGENFSGAAQLAFNSAGNQNAGTFGTILTGASGFANQFAKFKTAGG